MTEAQLQKQVCQFLDACLVPPAWWSTFPSDGASRRGRIGLKLGVPDLLLISVGNAYWIELKTYKGRISPQQIATQRALVEASPPFRVAVCHDLGEVITTLNLWTIPLRPHKLVA